MCILMLSDDVQREPERWQLESAGRLSISQFSSNSSTLMLLPEGHAVAVCEGTGCE